MLKSTLRSLSGRLWSNTELASVAPRLGHYSSVVNVSGWRDGDKEGNRYQHYFTRAIEYTVTGFPGDAVKGSGEDDKNNATVDLDLSQPAPSALVRSFDVVFNHTVLEHVEDPRFAFRQLAALTRDVLIVVVPWRQQLHFIEGNFGDFYRISPMMMRK